MIFFENKMSSWVYILYISAFCLSCVLAAFEYPEVFLYFVLVHAIYGIGISVVIAEWKNSGKVIVESKKDSWTHYHQGVPIKETHHALKNLHFSSPQQMKSSYLLILLPKLVISAGLFIMLIKHIDQGDTLANSSLSLAAIAFSTVFLLIRNYIIIRSLLVVIKGQWLISHFEKDDIKYGAAYIKNNDHYSPFLQEVFR
jgi:hypothetical protein